LHTVDLVIKNGILVTSAGRFEAGIAVDDGKIVLIGKEAHLPAADSVLDVKGKFILPGLIDSHVHIYETGETPSEPEREDIESGTEAAAAGGITTIRARERSTNRYSRR
jgi:dihydroorotase-like cyclic amidohydrolase